MEKQQIVKIIEFLSTCFTMPFIYAIKYYFYEKFLGFKNKGWKFILCLLLLIISDLFSIRIQSEAFKIIIGNVIWLSVICFLCNGNFLIKFYAFITLDTILLLINLGLLPFDFFLLPLTHNTNMTFVQNMMVSFTDNCIIDLICFFILFTFLKRICNLFNFKEKQINLYEGLYLLIPSLAIYSLAFIFYIVQKINIDNKNYYLPYIFPKIYYVLPFISFTLLISILISAYTFKKMIQGKEEQQKNMLMKQQLDLQVAHCKNVEGLYGSIRSIMHDMNNHVSCLKNLAHIDNNNYEIKKYLDNICETIGKLDFKIKTGNPISDVVINEKYNMAKNEGIKFICDFMIPNETSLQPVDLCVILSNALDNAIEACMRIRDTTISKKICVKSFLRGIYLIIEISNTTIDRIQYVDNKIISAKSDKLNHGIGISNIETSLKKYNGVFDIAEEKNKFTINIMLKIN